MSSFGRKKRNAEDNDFPDDINVREMFRVYETRDEIPEEGETFLIVKSTKGSFFNYRRRAINSRSRLQAALE